MTTVTLKLHTTAHIFQAGNILELDDRIVSEDFNGQLTEGYVLPDDGTGVASLLPLSFFVKEKEDTSELEEYYGKCILTRVDNYSDPAVKSDGAKEITGEVQFRKVEMIHYSDCQQLVFHMPEYAWDAGEIYLFDKVNQVEIFRDPVHRRISGGTMIVLDTLPYKPGFYKIAANWPNGWTHELHFVKMIPGFPFNEVYQAPAGNLTMIQNDREYRLIDSNGIAIANPLLQKHQAISDLIHKRVEYEQDGRGGTIRYFDHDTTINFGWEFAAGNGVVIIFVSAPEFWERATKTPARERQPILEFVAESVIRDKAPGCRYEIYDQFVEILRH